MKKLLAILLALAMLTCIFASCTNENNDADETTVDDVTTEAEETTEAETEEVVLSTDPVRVFTLKGPTGMGMAPLMESDEAGESKLNYEFTLASEADEFTGDIIQGNFEIACVPTNLASVLYNKTNGAIQVAAVNTLGVLYVLEDGNTITSIEDLEGKTIYSSGQGSVPEYALNYILDAFQINCRVIYESEHDLVVADLVSDKADIAVLPEPKVTAALLNENAPEELRVALDLTELWEQACEKNGDNSALYMGCIIVNKSWAEANPNEVAAFLEEYETSVNTVNTDPDASSETIAKFEIIPKAPMAKKAIPNCNIVFIKGDEMVDGLVGFFEVLYSYNASAVGGSVPTEDIFYIK